MCSFQKGWRGRGRDSGSLGADRRTQATLIQKSGILSLEFQHLARGALDRLVDVGAALALPAAWLAPEHGRGAEPGEAAEHVMR